MYGYCAQFYSGFIMGKADNLIHRRRKIKNIGGQGLEYWGAKGGANSQQAHDVVTTSM